MMKKILALVVALVFVFTTGVFAQMPTTKPAEPTKKTEPVKPAKKPVEKVKTIVGEVTNIDTAAKTITVKSKKQELTIAVTDEQIKGVKVGDKVEVKYVEKEGKAVAKSVKKVAAKAKKIEKKEEKKEEKKQ